MLEVERILVEKQMQYRLIRLSGTAVTVQEVIDRSMGDINPAEICKTIIIKARQGFIALFLRGGDKIDFNKLRQEYGKPRIASRAEVAEIAGVEPGAVCPLLLDIPVVVDARVLELRRLNFGSGDHLFGVEMELGDLAKVLLFTVSDFAEPGKQ